jgi:hypothetical protein
MGEMRNAIKIVVGKSGGKCHSEDLGICGKVDWIRPVQDRDQ